MKKIVIDLDHTLTKGTEGSYLEAIPNEKSIETLRGYQEKGFQIIIHTSRNMRTYENNVGLINVHTLPTILEWLEKHNVPFDEVIVGKPWCGNDGFYIDDKAIRPSEFNSKSYEEIRALLDNEMQMNQE